MPKNLLELLDSINKQKALVRSLVDEGKLDEAEEAKKELVNLQKKFDLLKDMEDRTPENPVPFNYGGTPAQTPANPEADAEREFANAARNRFAVNTVTPMTEGTAADGGYTVPEDIQTRIEHFKEANFSLRRLVAVESVKTNKGARTYQTKAQASGFAKVLENGAVQQASAPHFTRVTYDIEDYAGYIPVTNDLLADSDANITNEIVNWIGKNSLATDNNEILAILKGKDETNMTGLADLKKAINVTLGQAYRSAVVIVTNDDGLNYLDTLEDTNHRPLLNPNPTEPQKIQLRVGATFVPVEIVPNAILPSEPVYAATSDQSLVSGKTYYTRTGSGTTESPYVYTAVASPEAGSLASYYEVTNYKFPFIPGDLKEAVRIYDRKRTTILSSNVASVEGYNAFEQRGTLFRAEIRADYKAVDSDAWVNGYILETQPSGGA